ncbi:MAG TPA: ABC transporter permease [Candidatus Fraserbacteria bacterium]|nr:ABC transporter permease [Candidatus Fraserbacteria bacterium]
MHRVLRNRSLVLGALIIFAILFVAVFASWLVSFPLNEMNMAHRLAPPDSEHWMGTDNFGRDLWTRIAFGSRLSLLIALSSVGVSATLGTLIGLSVAYFGGWLDLLFMRVVDVFLGFPVIILALTLVAVLGSGPVNVTIALIAVFWTQYVRVVRSIALAERERDYVEAARAIGASSWRILSHHLLPNSLGPVIVLATLGLGTAIVAESALSFLGFGVQPPAPSWGWTLAYGMRYLRVDPYLSIFPGLAIMITVLGFNLFGDGLRDLLDPRGISR